MMDSPFFVSITEGISYYGHNEEKVEILFFNRVVGSILMIFITKVTSVAAKLSPIAQCAVCPKQLKLQKNKSKKRAYRKIYFSVSLL